MIYCDGENRRFPKSEFLHDKDGKVVQPYIHNTDNPHFAEGGKPIEIEIPELRTLAPREGPRPGESDISEPSLYLYSELVPNILELEYKTQELHEILKGFIHTELSLSEKVRLTRQVEELTHTVKKIVLLVTVREKETNG